MSSFLLDLRFAVRSLVRDRQFTFTALFTLALTIGGITTVFTLVNSVLLRPLPYPQSDRLVTISTRFELGDDELIGAAVADFVEWKERSRSLESMALLKRVRSIVNPDTDPRYVRLWSVTADLFPLLGGIPAMGRTLLPEDEGPNGPAVAVIGEDLWQEEFDRSEEVVGKTLRLSGKRAVTIVGVMPRDFKVPEPSILASVNYPEIWVPLRVSSRDFRTRVPTNTAIGRIAPGWDLDSAAHEMKAVSFQVAEDYPDADDGRVAALTPLVDLVVGDRGRILWVFLGAVTSVLLIGLANIISMQIARNLSRRPELAIRSALGASRGKVTLQLLIESVCLGLVGGGMGLGIATQAIRVVMTILPNNFPRADQVSLDLSVFTITLGTALVAGGVCGVVPAVCVVRPNLLEGIGQNFRITAGRGQMMLQRGLIVLETGTALVLLISSGLLLNSFWRLIDRDAGMESVPILVGN